MDSKYKYFSIESALVKKSVIEAEYH